MRWVVLLSVLAACKGEDVQVDPEPEPTTSPTTGPGWGDVAPIVEARCSGCHQPDGVAPFSLLTYADAKPWAGSMALAVSERDMPPWAAVDDGSCNSYQDSHWLADEEIDAIVAWAEAGAPEGAAVTAPLTPAAPPVLVDATLTLDLPEITPEAEGDLFAPNDEYRCFKFEDLSDQDTFLTGYEVVPGNQAIVHHVIGMIVDPSAPSWNESVTNAEEIARLEAEDTRPGWDCLGTVGGNGRERSIPIDWAPGQGAVQYPDGLGVRLAPHEILVVQVHYNLADPAHVGESDQTTVKVRLADSVPNEVFVGLPDPFLISLYDFPFVDTLPPGEERYEYTWELSGREILAWAYHPTYWDVEEFEVRAVIPHMHQRGVSQKLEIVRDGGGKDCGFDVPRWDFEWQRIYWYEEPLVISKDDTVRVTCTYDTSDTNDAVWPGWGTNNEMCLAGILLTVD